MLLRAKWVGLVRPAGATSRRYGARVQSPCVCRLSQLYVTQSRFAYTTLSASIRGGPRTAKATSRYLSTHSEGSVGLPPSPPPRGYVQLADRRLIAVHGPDAAKFINGLVTNRLVEGGDDTHDTFGFYAGFLNSKGRVLADAFIHPAHHSSLPSAIGEIGGADSVYLVDVHEACAGDIYSMLKMHKLRSKVSIEEVAEGKLRIWHVWDDTELGESMPLDIAQPTSTKPYCPWLVGATDTRAPGYGLRLVLPADKTPFDVLSDGYLAAASDAGPVEASIATYNVRRIVYGIPEGPKELIPGSSLPLDSCMELMGGVDFNKGCYVGQELTVRSHHHGIVRKRIIPVSLHTGESSDDGLEYNDKAEVPADLAGKPITDVSETLGNTSELAKVTGQASPFGVSRSERGSRKLRSSGTLLSNIGNVGLALVRLEHFGSATAQFVVETEAGPVTVRGYIPFWWPDDDTAGIDGPSADL